MVFNFCKTLQLFTKVRVKDPRSQGVSRKTSIDCFCSYEPNLIKKRFLNLMPALNKTLLLTLIFRMFTHIHK